MNERSWFAVVLLAGCAVPLSAQTPTPTPFPGVTPGERVRVNALGLAAPTQTQYGPDSGATTQTGVVRWVRNDTIAFRPDTKGSDTLQLTAVPVGHIERLDVSGGMHRHALGGLAWGGISGVVVGAVYGAASYSQCQSEVFGSCFNIASQGEYIATGAVVFGLLGGAVGTIVGALIKTERWVRVPGYPVAKLAVLPLPYGRVGYGLTLRL